jgi:CheY-like chemotaxis protein
VKRRVFILAGAFLVVWLAYLLTVMRDNPVEARSGGVATAASEPAREEETVAQKAAYQEQTRQRVAELGRLEAEQRRRSQLETRRRESLQDLGVLQTKTAAWSAILATNWPAYQALREQAAASPSKTFPCTLCDGRGQMPFCAVCEHSGKCVVCKGIGRTAFDEVCPTCRGSGKCYLCFGTGKMACLFCDDGVVYLKGPPPPTSMPMPATPVVPQEPERSVPAEPGPVASAASAPAQQPDPPARPSPRASPAAAPGGQSVALAIALVLGCILGVRKFAPRIGELLNTHFNPWTPTGAAVRDGSSRVPLDEESFSRFAKDFRTGPVRPCLGDSSANAASVSNLLPTPTTNPTYAVSHETKALFASIAKDIQMARSFLSEINRTTDLGGQQKLFLGLSAEVASLKAKTGEPGLLAIWQMACGLEGLLNQLMRKASNINASTLSTAARAVELLDALCIPDLRPDLAVAPAVRLLVVDDDRISRHAVSFALNKAFNEPNLAANSEAALVLTKQHSYDAIFLDVEMPGMDGFELCSKIRETALNRNTPVVFVTSHDGFEARARSTLVGGQDFIAKPFLTFEVAVKALTLILRGRLQSTSHLPEPETRPLEVAGV